MMRNERKDYKDCSEWLSALKEDDAWKSQKAQLMAPNANMKKFRRKALERIGNGVTYHLWDIYQHNIKPVVEQLWVFVDLSLPKMMIQVLGMLTYEWIEQHPELERACADPVRDEERISSENGDASSQNTRDPKSILLPRLCSPKMMSYWHELQKQGFIDENFQPTKGTTLYQQAKIAFLLSKALGRKTPMWKYFQEFWDKNYMAQTYSNKNIGYEEKVLCMEIEHIFKL